MKNLGELKQRNKFIAGQACTFDNAQRQTSTQVTTVPGYNNTAVVTRAKKYDVAAGLVVNFKPSAL